MVLAWMGSLSAPLYAQQFAHIDPLFFSKSYGGANPLQQVLTVTSDGAPIGFTASASTSTGGDWLTVSATEDCCMTPAPVSVLVSASAELAVGSYSGQVVLTGNGSSLVVEVHLVVTPADTATFDKTPSQLSFSMMPGGRASAQIMQISTVGGDTLQWRMIAATFNGADFLSVSAQTGMGPTRITVGVLPEKLPNAGATAGVYTGQLLFLCASSTVTIPVSVTVGDTEIGPVKSLTAKKPAGIPLAISPTSSPNPNLWPANTSNCFCGGFNNENLGFGPLTAAPDLTTSAKLVYEANPGNGVALHFAYIYADLGRGQQTLSFHFKADIDSWVYITSAVDGVTQRVWFNLTGSGAVGANIPAGWSAQITPLPNGWYRCSVTFSVVNNGFYNGFGLATMDQQYAYVGTLGNGVYEWGQQFQNGTLTDYQANLSPCLSLTKSADAGSVAAGSSIGYTIQAFNQASPALATTLNDPLPPGTGINWSISPTYGGPGTCAITGVVGSQTLACDFSTLPAGVGASVHIASGTSASSCRTYSNTATASVLNSSSFQATATTTVQCPTLSISKTHAGNFTQGQTGATYTVTVSNATGAGPTSGTVTVTETVPTGLTLVSMAGLATGWTCPPGGTTCTRSDALSGGSSYLPITVTVNVAGNATSPLVNSVSVSGGGAATANATDSTTISPAVVVPVSVTPSSGSGTQQTFNLVYTDSAGMSDLNTAWVWFDNSASSSVTNTCLAYSYPRANALYLLNDAGSAFLGPITVGSSNSLSNSQCTISGSGSSTSTAGESDGESGGELHGRLRRVEEHEDAGAGLQRPERLGRDGDLDGAGAH